MQCDLILRQVDAYWATMHHGVLEVLQLPADPTKGPHIRILGTWIASKASAGGWRSLLPTDRSMRDRPLLAAAALALSITRKAPGSGVL